MPFAVAGIVTSAQQLSWFGYKLFESESLICKYFAATEIIATNFPMTREPAKLHPFLHSADLLEKRVQTLLVETGVRHRQALILDALQRLGPSSQQHLAKQFGLSAGSMSSMTERLVALDLITQRTDPNNRRSNILEISGAGRSALAAVFDVWQFGDELIEKALGPEDAERLHGLTTKLRDALGGVAPKAR